MKPGAEDSQSKDILVFWLVQKKDSSCSQCQKELGAGNFLTIENGKGLCMTCADLDHLVFLASGDHALTRRAKKNSTLWAVVVRFSRARKRYERQGLLVEEEALAQAEQECLADEDRRARQRERAEEYRLEQDEKLAAAMQARLLEMFPGCPAKDAEAIALHTSKRGSGRVGRSEAGRNLDEEALRLAAVAYVRHKHTDYDQLLMSGMERWCARESVQRKVAETIGRWAFRAAHDA
jgi:hypothetical protein